MSKERVLVRDDKGVFLKMFKRNFKEEFDFSESCFLVENESESKQFDRSIFVVYDKTELLEFLKLKQKGTNDLVCLFNKQLHNSLSVLQHVRNLILVDNSKTRIEIMKELKSYFKNKSGLPAEMSVVKVPNTAIIPSQSDSFYKALFFMM